MAKKTSTKAKVRGGVVIRPQVYLEIHDLNPSPYNPRKISSAMFEALKENIRSVGFIEPVIVQKKTNAIISGHQRTRAMREIAVEDGVPIPKLPCVVLDLDDREAKKLNLKMNKIGGEFDARLLGEVLVDIASVPLLPEDYLNLGFLEDEALRYIHLVDPPEVSSGTEEISTFGRSVTLSLAFSDTKTRDAVKALLLKRCEVEKKTSGAIVEALLRARSKR